MIRRTSNATSTIALLLALSIVAAGAARAEAPTDPGPPTADQDSRININEAAVDALVTLPGIGPSRADAIVREREKRPFRRVEDIMRVPGIGRKTYLRIRSSIRVR